MNIEELLNKYKFQKYSDIVERNDKIMFQHLTKENNNKHGWVYAWIEQINDKCKVVYIGKAGKTILERCNQHESGFNGGSKTGKQHAERIKKGIKGGKSYYLYVRKSDEMTVIDEPNISMCSIEEIVLIKKLLPQWNKL